MKEVIHKMMAAFNKWAYTHRFAINLISLVLNFGIWIFYLVRHNDFSWTNFVMYIFNLSLLFIISAHKDTSGRLNLSHKRKNQTRWTHSFRK